ncbi:hypothetical protein [Paracidovorax konjaci]|uniref:Uncharacterized protein n=1 Tax=Paracidovorax konjaci TaxID=32040 RepID=A0A1I1VG77_9BURK|nr:hypothetical protein [Paracidovorax konjaci]SFD80093.1 hypothetical protein SAMN04489710_106172 [Paracidovorax konjaci]
MPTNFLLPRLGIDIGRVLIAPDGADGGDTSFIGGSLDDALATPPCEGMFEHVPVLVDRFQGRVWLVSKAGPRVQEKTLRWLEHHHFHGRTGIPESHVRFCRERPQKADHCRALGITHFIDDREDVLRHLEGVVPHRFLFGPQRRPVADPQLRPVLAWDAAFAQVMATLASSGGAAPCR